MNIATRIREAGERGPRPAKLDARAMRALIKAGVLHDRRVELIEGELIEMSPGHNRHGAGVFALAGALLPKLQPGLQGVADGALFLSDDTMLGPDIALLPKDVLIEEAKAEQIVLAIEISNSTLAHDLNLKAGLYAAHGVPEYWVVDLPNRKLHIHTLPGEAGYGSIVAHDWVETVSHAALGGAPLNLEEVIGA